MRRKVNVDQIATGLLPFAHFCTVNLQDPEMKWDVLW